MKAFAIIVCCNALCWASCVMAASDMELVLQNMGRESGATHPEVSLHPRLNVVPPRKTIMAGEAVPLVAEGATNAITWFMVDGPSGGSFSSVNSSSILYRAGSTSAVVDVIQAWDGYNMFGRAYLNVISPEDVARAGKAIIVAGRRGATDSLWPTTDYLADLGYETLRYRGFSRENINYLSPVPDKDVDGNGIKDDIDAESTYANVGHAFTNWAARAGTERLFVYLVDHGEDSGGKGYFRLNENEKLEASELDGWLDDMQDAYSNDVVVVIDCCYAGSLADELGYTGTAQRIVLAACASNQPTYFVAGGLVSFSDAVFSGMMLGLNLQQMYDQASGAMSAYQDAVLFDPENQATNVEIGASFVAGKDIPYIGSVLGNQLLQNGSTATMWADDVVSAYTIDRVWCLIIPPGNNPDPDDPVSDLTELDLTYDPLSGRYEARYSGFSEEGTYGVLFYAKDVWGSVSLPKQSFITQASFDERLILIAGGTTSDVQRAAIERISHEVYHTFRKREFSDDALMYMDADLDQDLDKNGTNDVDRLSTLADLEWAITDWAATTNASGPADKLTVYLVGPVESGAFRLNETETLSAAQLDGWLDTYQSSGGVACVVMDFSESGAYIPAIKPPAGKERLCVASASIGQQACYALEGTMSFSQYFLSDVFIGRNIADCISRKRMEVDGRRRRISQEGAKWAIYYATGNRQEAMLDADGDGIANESEDYTLASDWHIGMAFVTGADVPTVNTVMPDSIASISNTVMLWASDVTGVEGISNVWCVLTPPSYDGSGDLPMTNLSWNATSVRYEAVSPVLGEWGTYVCTFLAMDANGEVSGPVQAEVTVGDAYETDDDDLHASGFSVGVDQLHNFHTSNDVDWVAFYAVSNFAYNVETYQEGASVDTVLDIYEMLDDGSLTNLVHSNTGGAGESEFESVVLTKTEGLRYVRVSSAAADGWGPDSQYWLMIYVEQTGGPGHLLVIAVNKLTGEGAPPGAVAIIDGVATNAFNGNKSVEFTSLSAGSYIVRVPSVPGYIPESDPVHPYGVDDVDSALYGNPKSVALIDDEWRFAIFQFVPVVTVEGLARDAWTGARVGGAQIEFTATSGRIAGQVYDGYPNQATYETNWRTGEDGSFPTNVVLPSVNWNLSLSADGYSNTVTIGAVTNPVPGQTVDVATVVMIPVDTNGNLVADEWELAHPDAVVDGICDSDNDGMNDKGEYVCGTNPNDAFSVFKANCPSNSGPSAITLRWSVVPGRTYQVCATGDLSENPWPVVAGPSNAVAGQVTMDWTDSQSGSVERRFYRVEVVAP